MRYNSIINNVKSLEWELNLAQAYLFSWIYELASWADKVIIENEVYYFASKNKACEELPILTDKTDTMYRYYKQLEEKKLILIKKIDGKDYVSLTLKAKQWNLSIQSDRSERNPSGYGNESESKTDLNPTYNNTNSNNEITNKNHDVKSDLFSNSDISVIPISVDILKYLNKIKPSKIPFEFNKVNLSFIEARIKEKFKEDDFKKVIDHKVSEWKDNPKMKKYIRPATLFGDKFNGYLVEAHETKSDGSGNFQFNPTSKAELL
jgi:uncharacterized phage protein (TIGR02220 family)